MASADDVKRSKEQVSLAEELNKVIAERAKMLEKQKGAYADSLALATELRKVLASQTIEEGTIDRVKEMSKALREAGDAAEGASDQTGKMGEAAKKAFDPKKVSSMSELVEGLGKKYPKLTKFVKGFNAALAIGTAIYKGLMAAAQAFGGTISAIYGLANDLFGAVVAAAEEAAQFAKEVAEAYEDLRGEFGNLAEGVGQDVSDSINAMKNQANEAGVSLGRIFGPFAAGARAMLAAVGEAVKSLGALAAGPFKGQVAEASLSIMLLTKGAGLSEQAIQNLGNRALNAGETLTGVMNEAAMAIVQVAKATGQSEKTIGKAFSEIASDAETFGHLTVQEMANLSAVMTETAISMQTVQSVANQFDDFKNAADNVAKLTQAFGMNLNAIDLLNASDEDRLQMLRDSFDATGKSIDQLTRQERKYLATSAGISASDLERVFGDQAGAIEETKTQAELAQEAQIQQAEVLKELADEIKSVIVLISGLTGYFDAFFKGFDRGFKEGNSVLTMLYLSLQAVEFIGHELGQTLGNALERLEKETGWVSGFIENVKEGFRGLSDIIKFLAGDATVDLEKAADKFFNMLLPKEGGILDIVMVFVDRFVMFLSDPGVQKKLLEAGARLMQFLGDSLKSPLVQGILVAATASAIGAFIVAVVGSVLSALPGIIATVVTSQAITSAITTALGGGAAAGGATAAGEGAGGAIASALGLFTNPAGWITLAVLAVTALLTAVGQVMKLLGRDLIIDALGSLGISEMFASFFFEAVTHGSDLVIGGMQEIFGGLFDSLGALFEGDVEGFQDGIIRAVLGALQALVGAVEMLIPFVLNALYTQLILIPNMIQTVFIGVATFIPRLIAKLLDSFLGTGDMFQKTMLRFTGFIVNPIKGIYDFFAGAEEEAKKVEAQTTALAGAAKKTSDAAASLKQAKVELAKEAGKPMNVDMKVDNFAGANKGTFAMSRPEGNWTINLEVNLDAGKLAQSLTKASVVGADNRLAKA